MLHLNALKLVNFTEIAFSVKVMMQLLNHIFASIVISPLCFFNCK